MSDFVVSPLALGVAVGIAYIVSLLMRAVAPKPDEGFGEVFIAILIFFGIGFAGHLLFGF